MTTPIVEITMNLAKVMMTQRIHVLQSQYNNRMLRKSLIPPPPFYNWLDGQKLLIQSNIKAIFPKEFGFELAAMKNACVEAFNDGVSEYFASLQLAENARFTIQPKTTDLRLNEFIVYIWTEEAR